MSTTRFGTWHELRVLRERTGFSAAKLANTTILQNGKPMSPGYLSDLESGKRWPNPTVVKALSTALNVPYTVLERHESEEVAS